MGLAVGAVAAGALGMTRSAPRWYKGMLHAHTCWPDGWLLPEQAGLMRSYRARIESSEPAVYANAIDKMHPPMKVGWPQPYCREQIRYIHDVSV